MPTNLREIRSSLVLSISKLRRMSLADLEELTVSDTDPAFALEVRRDATVELMLPEAYDADPSRAVVVRPFRTGALALKSAMEDAEAILAEDQGIVLRDAAPKSARGAAVQRKPYRRSERWYVSRGLPIPEGLLRG